MNSVVETTTTYEGILIGEVTHFFKNILVAVINPTETISVGDAIRIYDKQGNIILEQTVDSMEIDGNKIQSAQKDQSFGIKVVGDVKEGYLVYRQ